MRKTILAFALLWGAPALADSTIDALGNAAALSGTENVPIFQTANPAVKTTAQAIANLASTCPPNAQTGTTYTFLDGDRGKCVSLSNGSSIAVTLPQAGASSQFISGWYTNARAGGAGTVTITPTTSTIDGAASLTLTTNQGVGIFSDGTNYFTFRGRVPSFLQSATQGGNTTKISTISGSLVSGNCVEADANGNLVDYGGGCGAAAPSYVASNWYAPTPAGITQAGVTPSASQFRCIQTQITQKVTIGALGVTIGTGSAGNNLQLGLYTSVNGRPGVLLSNTASISTTSTGAVSAALAANKQVGPGGADGGRVVWLCINQDNTAAITTGYNLTGLASSGTIGSATLANVTSGATNTMGITCAGAACNTGSSTFNTWQTLSGSTWSDGVTRIVPVIAWQAASVP